MDFETGEELDPNESGEICIRGEIVMKGYHNRPKETKEIIDNDGFLHTGDIGYVDEDGYFFIMDRVKELIKVNGFQVNFVLLYFSMYYKKKNFCDSQCQAVKLKSSLSCKIMWKKEIFILNLLTNFQPIIY